MTSEVHGEQPIHRLLKAMPVLDRIRFIRQYTNTLKTDEERGEFYKEIIRNGVITEKGLDNVKTP